MNDTMVHTWDGPGRPASVFHAGELALQHEAGVAARLARHPQLLSDHLPEQHRAFYPLLPFIVVGSLDAEGQPNASLLAGPPARGL